MHPQAEAAYLSERSLLWVLFFTSLDVLGDVLGWGLVGGRNKAGVVA